MREPAVASPHDIGWTLPNYGRSKFFAAILPDFWQFLSNEADIMHRSQKRLRSFRARSSWAGFAPAFGCDLFKSQFNIFLLCRLAQSIDSLWNC